MIFLILLACIATAFVPDMIVGLHRVYRRRR